MTARTGRSRAAAADRTPGPLRRPQAGSGQTRAPERLARPPLYLGIARVSTEDQAANGHSLDAQDATLRAEADRRGVRVEMVPIPARSGRAMSPELRRVLDRLGAGEAQGLMVTKLDRLTRSVRIASDIIETAQRQGWNLVIADINIDLSTVYGRAMAQMLAVFAEVERELISIRTKEGLAAAKAKHVRIGRPPLVASAVVDQIYLLRDRDGLSFAAIAQELTDTGEPSPSGRPTWQPSTVRRIFERHSPGSKGNQRRRAA